VVAILPPSAALKTARQVAEAMASAGKKRPYADCHAVSPETTQRIGKEITRVGADYIDGAELFSLSSEPLRVWVCLASDSQDAINELMNCVWSFLTLLRNKNGGPVLTAALKRCRISLLMQSSFMVKSRGGLATPPGLECTCNGGSGKPADL